MAEESPDRRGGMKAVSVKSFRHEGKSVLSIDSFPPEMRDALAETFDQDGDGAIDAGELLAAAQLFRQTKATNRLLRRGVYAALAMSAALVAAVTGLTYGIVDASKDTTVAGRALLTREEEPVSVGTNELQLSLAALAFMPGDVAAKIDDVTFASEEGDKFYYRKARSIDVTPETGLEITTTAGDRLTWDADNGGDIVVTLVDGTSWTKDDACTSCTAMNVYASPAVIEGVKKFEEATEAEGRRLAQKNHGINFNKICKWMGSP